jgi:hypothetical protein
LNNYYEINEKLSTKKIKPKNNKKFQQNISKKMMKNKIIIDENVDYNIEDFSNDDDDDNYNDNEY